MARPEKNCFVHYVTGDLLAGMGGVTGRAMFGGFGVYKDGVIFAIIVNDELYLKADDGNRAQFAAAQSAPFAYLTKSGKRVAMSYWKAPEEILEDAEEMARWADESYRAALRLAKKKDKKVGGSRMTGSPSRRR